MGTDDTGHHNDDHAFARRGRDRLDQLARRAVVTDAAGVTVDEAPGLYVRLFAAVALGTGLEVVGGRRRGKSTGSPAPLRLEVMDAIDAIARFAFDVEATQRRAAGFGPARRTSTDVTRARWGLTAHSAALGGVTADDRVLESLTWIQTTYDAVATAPTPWRTYVDDELRQLVSTARRLLGIARARANCAACPYCALDTIYFDPADSELVVCINVLCRDENGDPPEWRGLRQWAALNLAA